MEALLSDIDRTDGDPSWGDRLAHLAGELWSREDLHGHALREPLPALTTRPIQRPRRVLAAMMDQP